MAGIGPAKGSGKRYFYDTYDVSRLLRAGENFVAAEVHSPGRPTFSSISVIPAFWIELDGILGSNSAWETMPDPTRRCDSPVYAPQLGFSEWRDFRKERVGWQTFADQNDGWVNAEELGLAGSPGGRMLVPRDVPNLRNQASFPKRIVSCGNIELPQGHMEDKESSCAERMQFELHRESAGMAVLDGACLHMECPDTGTGYCILDFECENFGTLHLEVEGSENGILDIGYGDALYEGRVKTFQNPYRFADRYILRAGRQNIDHLIHDRGFRFVQLVIRGFSAPACIAIKVNNRSYPMPVRAMFESSDPFLNQLWESSANTLGICANDTFVDCPWREQAFWVNDTLVVFPYYFSLTCDAALPARCLRLAADGQRANGLIPSVYPSAEVEHSTFPSMSAIWTLMLADYYLYTGDRSLVCELIPVMEKALSIYQSWADPDGLIPNQKDMWNFIEWASPGSRPETKSMGTTTALNLLVAAAYRAAGGLQDAVGNIARASEYRAMKELLVASVTGKFWISEERRFLDNLAGPASFSQHSHALGLYYGLFRGIHRESAVAALSDPNVTEADFYFQHFTINALAREGHAMDALAVIRRLWGEMVADNSPTVWETTRGKEEFDGVGSLCHAFACAPLYFMQAVLLGVRPLLPGFSEFSLSPECLDVSFARGAVPTPHGFVHISWERLLDGTIRVEAEIPDATCAVLSSGARLSPGHHAFVL